MSRGCCVGLGWERVVAKWSFGGGLADEFYM